MLQRLSARLLLVVAALLAGTAALAQDLRIGLGADVTSMDPHHLNIGSNNNALWHVYDALTHVGSDARLVPGLAESWRAVEPTVWEFKLRHGVRFHDGQEFAAEDVIASIERARATEKTGGQFGVFTKAITAMRAVDRHTVRFTTATPYAMLPYDLNSIFIISRRSLAATTEDFNSGRGGAEGKPVHPGTGPFRLLAFRRGDRIELTRNQGYWAGTPAFANVSLRLLPNDGPRIAALLAGDVDMIENIPTADAAKLRTNQNFTLGQKVSWRTIFFHMDQARDNPPGLTAKDGKPLGRNPFKDIRVRQAISRAINRTAIAERVMENLAIPAANVVAPPVFGHASALRPDAFEPDAARKLLAEAGFPDGFAMVLAAPNNRYVNDDQVAQTVAQMLSRIGIATKLETHPAATYFTKARAGEFAFAMLGWGSFSGDLALRSLLATPDPAKGYGSWNWGRHSLPKVDELLDRGFQMTDEKAREANAVEAATLALRNYGVIPVHHQIATWAMKRGLAYDGRTDEFTFAHFVRAR
ncbi:MAG: ABC transporter substrate-binding protein [Burkholderiales bacterium]|nr:ABC transporter substrate-binding protein [Burkholderiales bacterium]